MDTDNDFALHSEYSEDIQHVWRTVTVPLGANTYDILIGPGLLTELGEDLKSNLPAPRYIIITDSNVEDYLGADLIKLLGQGGVRVELLSFAAGEESKNMDTVVDLARRMIDLGADRQTAILALGGGVVGDVAGFLASIYMRGVPLVQIPTTLLAQVDSSVGGKTGVDLPEGKNLLGTFYQPGRVYADIGVLTTLPQAEIRNGLAEVVKYGMIQSPELFDFLEEKWWDIINLEPHVTAHIVFSSCSIKADVVSADEREGDLRRILNFGHTVGHAVEAAAHYQIPHGEAVSMGMVVVSRISVAKGLMPEGDLERLCRLLDRLNLPKEIPANLSAEELMDLLRHDKKAKSGRPHFVLSRGIGQILITDDVSREELAVAIGASREFRAKS
ncbi:MAG: 3-dehydroquinate synthase [Thermodesulfobacteriota bacterium]|nr:3-dehydroquinate synthase [Thermodesulfobacteriota bacterium]